MSRRDRERDRDQDRGYRDTDSKRRRSGFDRELSPKKSRRDEKPDTERTPGDAKLDVRYNTEHEHKDRRKLQDSVPLDAPSAPDSKEDSHKKTDGNHEGNDRVPHPTQVPRSRAYFQHDERSSASRNYGRRAANEHHWRDSKDERPERPASRSVTYDSQQRDQKSQAKGDDDNVWHHDGFFKLEAEHPPPKKKRPAFTDKKMPLESENADKTADEPAKLGLYNKVSSFSTERGSEADRRPRHLDRYRADAGGQGETQTNGLRSRERHGVGGGNYRGRERFGGKQDYYRSGNRGDKWKHDLYDEANETPITKNEEDQIAKVEALLAS